MQQKHGVDGGFYRPRSETGEWNEIRELQQSLFRYCLSLTESAWDAEDLAQEAILRALPVICGERSHQNPLAYLMRIAKNSRIDRKRRARFETIDQQLCEEACLRENPFPNPSDVEAALERIVRRLTPLQMTVFLLRDVFKYTSPEVSRWLEISEGAVKACLHRARTSIAAQKRDSDEVTGADSESEKPISAEWIASYLEAFRQADAQALVRLAYERTKPAVSAIAIGHMTTETRSRVDGRIDGSMRIGSGSVIMGAAA
ncbi:RNA polymerase sigma factor [Paenibacillus humicola]|uniref:RNA polymerase sigma factor n=1 Tax=Paenibacillus humicola TaxID=3110540 RepID=UPI00237C0A54|nr:RNA polymerase sigma factor [Paenibacillus humicola]